jgi:thymidylate kinase
MPFISFLGCDGSGKSAVIQQLTERLRAEGHEVVCGHWRPKAFATNPTETGGGPTDDPHGQAPRGLASSSLKLAWLWLNWWIGWCRGLGRVSKSGFVLFDRFHGDLLVDPRRYRYGGPIGLAKLATRLMPQPDRVLFLDAPPDVLLARKQEVSKEALEKSRASYLALCQTHERFLVIDASQALEDVVDDVYQQLMKHC